MASFLIQQPGKTERLLSMPNARCVSVLHCLFRNLDESVGCRLGSSFAAIELAFQILDKLFVRQARLGDV